MLRSAIVRVLVLVKEYHKGVNFGVYVVKYSKTSSNADLDINVFVYLTYTCILYLDKKKKHLKIILTVVQNLYTKCTGR